MPTRPRMKASRRVAPASALMLAMCVHACGPETAAVHPAGEAVGSAGRELDTARAGGRIDDPEPVRPPFVARGHVRDEAGVALPGARVSASWSSEEPFRALGTTTTDAEGAYAIEVREASLWPPAVMRHRTLEIRASAPGHLTARRWWEGWPPEGRVASATVDLALEAARLVTGRIVDEAGDPVAGADVTCAYGDPDVFGKMWFHSTLSDVDGVFRLRFEASPQNLTVKTHQRGGTWWWWLPPAPDDSGDLEVGDVALSTAGVLGGRLIYADGRPAAGVLVVAAPVEAGDAIVIARHGDKGPRCRTDLDGRFLVVIAPSPLGFDPDPFAIYAVFGGDLSSLDEGQVVDACYPVGSRDLEIVLDVPRLVVEVVDPTGRPLPGVFVFRDEMLRLEDGQLLALSRLAARTADDGTTDFRFRAGYTLRLRASVDGVGEATRLLDTRVDALDVCVRLELAPVRTAGSAR